MTYPNRDPRPADRPIERHEAVPPTDPAVERAEVVERPHNRVRTVRTVCAVIDVICWVFAIVLAIHILLVVANANMANGFAQFVEGWASAVNLGLRDLFTPADAKLAVLFNEGLAAIIWLVIGGVLTNLITRTALPADERHIWYRRRVS